MTESLRDIRIFVAAYEERSFTAAATRENASPSGVSQHIRKIEEDLKVALFSRSKGQALIKPTPAADVFYDCCVKILRNIASANAAMRAFSGLSGEVNVGLIPALTHTALTPAIQRAVSRHANIRIHVTESFSPILTQKVVRTELDFSIVPALASDKGLKVSHFLRTWETLVARPDTDFHLRPLRLQDFRPLKIVLPSHANSRRTALETYFITNGVKIARVIEMDSMMGTLDFISNSDWVTILPALMMTNDIACKRFSVVPLIEPTASLDLVVIEPMHRTLTVAAQAFLEIMKEEANRSNNVWRPYFDRR